MLQFIYFLNLEILYQFGLISALRIKKIDLTQNRTKLSTLYKETLVYTSSTCAALSLTLVDLRKPYIFISSPPPPHLEHMRRSQTHSLNSFFSATPHIKHSLGLSHPSIAIVNASLNPPSFFHRCSTFPSLLILICDTGHSTLISHPLPPHEKVSELDFSPFFSFVFIKST